MIEEKLFLSLAHRVGKGEKAALAIVTEVGGSTPAKPGIMMAVFQDGHTLGTVGGGSIELETTNMALDCIEKGCSQSFYFSLKQNSRENEIQCSGSSTVFIRVLLPKPKLIIIGAGHVSLEVYKIAKTQNFEISIVDNRKELCNKERFNGEAEILLGDIVENLANIEISKDTFIVIAGPNHDMDEKALESVIGRGAKYIGVLGSKKKLEKIKENLMKKGIEKEELDSIYSPIGLDMGSNLPSEIAVGIVGEIIRVKNEKIE